MKPTERLSADQILSHPWLDDHIVRWAFLYFILNASEIRIGKAMAVMYFVKKNYVFPRKLRFLYCPFKWNRYQTWQLIVLFLQQVQTKKLFRKAKVRKRVRIPSGSGRICDFVKQVENSMVPVLEVKSTTFRLNVHAVFLFQKIFNLVFIFWDTGSGFGQHIRIRPGFGYLRAQISFVLKIIVLYGWLMPWCPPFLCVELCPPLWAGSRRRR